MNACKIYLPVENRGYISGDEREAAGCELTCVGQSALASTCNPRGERCRAGWQELDDWMLAAGPAAGEQACKAQMKQSANAADTSGLCLSRRQAAN